ncbi:uncharacterized protein C8Q71DRAFT_854467 [Rhodofomes roseus]|uniref:Uncharacterized protein n=1 Tax=Rhodofomes roseus TaxID=34475 RepID=A0ABQ8KQ89_9APHY|nr:uncharacterized protein C8Q71DRAFT_854467 [Rhodofomes roseus]KAH9840583.1 hypothetical protein C8Q71DRAFT_854467 [Rhodofomes roseus]
MTSKAHHLTNLGILYFLTLLLVNLLELVVMRSWVTSSSASVATTSYMLVPVSSILITHFLINLQEIPSHRERDIEMSQSPDPGTILKLTTFRGADLPVFTSMDGIVSGVDDYFVTPPPSIGRVWRDAEGSGLQVY